ncbi:von Willebrand factor A domain-containing protein 5A [Vanrija pseudolonga]|uniref:von Willebrand factor A domain-containing protein 5A n=1 Tax=Vanrija pseudolonga TaxID=143232 RepID=A0AAF0Y6R0_9TREE|nr:von Willebrand factor A domain-containing protein 5A [Vanrija pseudolonga]
MASLPWCGCYTVIKITEPYERYEKKYLPIVGIKSHTRILATTSRTTLTQTFQNTNDKALKEVQYTFPLYDGVTVVGFTFTVAGVTTRGLVKEREEAKAEYKAAVDRGETAGLLEQSLDAGDVFATSIGNVPAGETVTVKIEYLGVLNHDAQVDGIRLTIPTAVAPRYGASDSYSTPAKLADEPFQVTVDAEMPAGSVIKSIQSPSHTLTVNIGTTSAAPDAEPSFSKASASLALKSTTLDKDFVVQVVATNLGEPSAVLETHPTLPNQRAIMASLVPKFELPSEAPELVFICDRSGSMGAKMSDLRSALQIFLKSLPVGVKFNICCFGSSFDFLWPKSQTYSAETLKKAAAYVDGFVSNYGGTEMYQPVEATFKQRYTDLNLEVFLLTDGEIWDQDKLFQLINENVETSKGAVRVFTLGIGSGASSALVEGAACAGKGFSQSVADNEKMDKKVIRMLKASLLPHISDYTLEIKYDKPELAVDGEDDFEIIDKVGALVIDDRASEKTVVGVTQEPAKPVINLFNKDQKTDDTIKVDLNSALPVIAEPKYLQTPYEIPPLFPFNRTNVYVLLSDSTPTRTPTSIILRATSKHGPLQLDIPLTVLENKQETIHQLAARDAVKDLEEGRGWLTKAKDANGKLVKDKHPGRFDDLVKREAVRLGVRYQVGGKWCSFVAIQDSTEEKNARVVGEAVEAHKNARNEYAYGGPVYASAPASAILRTSAPRTRAMFRGGAAAVPPPPPAPMASAPMTGAMFSSRGSAAAAPPPPPAPMAPALPMAFGAPATTYDTAPAPGGLFGGRASAPLFGGFGGSSKKVSSSNRTFDSRPGFGFGSSASSAPLSSFGQSSAFGTAPTPALFGDNSSAGGPFGQAAPRPSAFGSSAAGARGLFGPKPQVAGSLGAGVRPLHHGVFDTSMIAPANTWSAAGGQVRATWGADDDAAALPPHAPPPAAPKPRASTGYGSPAYPAATADEVAVVAEAIPVVVEKEVALPADSLGALIQLQAFEGNWSWSAHLERILGTAASKYATAGDVTATAATIAFFKKKLADDREVWELVVEKAEAWLAAEVGDAAAKAFVADLEGLF